MSFRVLTIAGAAVIGAASFVAPALAADDKVDLRPKLEAGKEHRFAMNVEAQTEVSSPDIPGMQQKQSLKQDSDYLLRVKEVGADRSATFELVYEVVKLSVNMDANSAEFDSASPAEEDQDNQLAPFLRPLVGKVITVKVDSQGRITEITGAEDLASPATDQFIGRENVASQIIAPLYAAPAAAPGDVEIGQTWTRVDELAESPLGTLKLTTDFKLASIQQATATVDLSGKLALAESTEEGADKPDFEIKESENTGKIFWDTGAGMLKNMEQSQRLLVAGDMQGLKINWKNDMQIKLRHKS